MVKRLPAPEANHGLNNGFDRNRVPQPLSTVHQKIDYPSHLNLNGISALLSSFNFAVAFKLTEMNAYSLLLRTKFICQCRKPFNINFLHARIKSCVLSTLAKTSSQKEPFLVLLYSIKKTTPRCVNQKRLSLVPHSSQEEAARLGRQPR